VQSAGADGKRAVHLRRVAGAFAAAAPAAQHAELDLRRVDLLRRPAPPLPQPLVPNHRTAASAVSDEAGAVRL